MNIYTIPKIISDMISDHAKEMLQSNETEKTFFVKGTKVQVTLALANTENKEKYKNKYLDIQKHHGHEFLYIQ